MRLEPLCWPLSELGQATAILLGQQTGALPSPASVEALPEWMNWAALRAECGAEACDVGLRDLEALVVHQPGPAVYEVHGRYLAVARSGKKLEVVTPDQSRLRIPSETVMAALRAPFEAEYLAEAQAIATATGLAPAKQQRLTSALLKEQVGTRRFRRGWSFRPEADKSAVIRGIPTLIGLHMAEYLLWLASWGVLGTLSFSGHLDRGWLLAWTLLLLMQIPFRMLTTWSQGTYAIRLGAMLKRCLLRGALRLEPEEVRASGVGVFMGQALEGEAIETLAISGGLTGLLALLEMVPAMFILGRLAAALALWCLVALSAAWVFFRSYTRWTNRRMGLTSDLIEAMVGHGTRLAQQQRTQWHTSDDAAMSEYLMASAKVDVDGSWLMAAVPRGWLLLGLAAIAPSIIAGRAVSSETAILLGGVLLAFSAFQRLVASFADVAGAVVGWKRVKPLLEAAKRREAFGDTAPTQQSSRKNPTLLEAHRLTYRYDGQAKPAVQSCDLSIRRGERVLLEGPSGGGKTTLASLLAGIRKPESGLLLIDGLDRYTLGDAGWRKRVAAAPQFHENHVVTGTLAFNLLLGRQWPASNEDMEEAELVCVELGLGPLLEQMPSGLMQMVGEGGWQLSHGERSRIFLARALLQNAEMVILDESFAALDPENLQLAMKTAFSRAQTLLVIAHP